MKRGYKDERNSIKIFFDNEKAAKHFIKWLSEQGEQDYWTWMECREQEETGNITATEFKYRLKDLAIDADCSRLDKK